MAERITQPVFKNDKGYNVWVEGPVIIESVQHYVLNGYVLCNASLNGRSWNTTEQKGICPACYPVKTEPVQLKLF
jgi:hypothetical protein